MPNQIWIWNNDPSTLPYDVKRVESVFVVDTLDVTHWHNQDVSVDCACSAEMVYWVSGRHQMLKQPLYPLSSTPIVVFNVHRLWNASDNNYRLYSILYLSLSIGPNSSHISVSKHNDQIQSIINICIRGDTTISLTMNVEIIFSRKHILVMTSLLKYNSREHFEPATVQANRLISTV